MHEAISAYYSCVASIVARFNGFVGKHLGNAVLVFRFPGGTRGRRRPSMRAGLELGSAISALIAEIAFKKAAKIAQQQRAKLCELRARMSHACLLVKQGKRERARDLLAPLRAWSSEGLETRQLNDAEALLEELAKRAPVGICAG